MENSYTVVLVVLCFVWLWVLLWCTLPVIQLTHFKCTSQWLLVTLTSSVNITITQFQDIFMPQLRTLLHIYIDPFCIFNPFLHLQPQATTDWLAFSGYFIFMESYCMWSLEDANFFHLAWCFWGSCVMWHLLAVSTSIPSYEYTIFCLFFHQLMDVYIVPGFSLLWMMLLWTFMCRSLCGYMCYIFWLGTWEWNPGW